MNMGKKIFFLISSCFIFVFFAQSTYAFTSITREVVTVPKTQTINGSLFTAGRKIDIMGKVEGDIFCAGETIIINSNVNGDVICAGQSIHINGVVNGNIRVAAQTLIIDGKVIRNITAAAQSIDSSAQIHGEVNVVGQSLNITGIVNQNVNGSLQSATIDGVINHDVNLQVDELTINKDALIKGNLFYTSNNQAYIGTRSAVLGLIHRERSEKENIQNTHHTIIPWIVRTIISILIYLLISLFIVFFWPQSIKSITENIRLKFWQQVGKGILFIGIVLLTILLLIITIIGIPLALLLGLLFIAFLFISRIFLGILMGKMFIERFIPKQRDSFLLASTIGIPPTFLMFSIPIIGNIASFICVLAGFGGLFSLYKSHPTKVKTISRRKKRKRKST